MRLFADLCLYLLLILYYNILLIFLELEDGDSAHSLGFITYPGIKKIKTWLQILTLLYY